MNVTARSTPRWQVQEAKNRLSELLRAARTKGPQTITHRGEDEAVVLSIEEYRRLTQPKESLLDFLRRSPLADVDLVIERSKDPGREIDL